MKSQLSQRLKSARMAITPPITQRDVAKRLELTPSAVNLWEAGKTEPAASHLAEMARWYQVSTDWLLGVDSSDTMTNGCVVLATAAKSDEPVLRKYVKEGGTELLIADDMRYPSYKLADGAKIIGKVTEVVIRRILN